MATAAASHDEQRGAEDCSAPSDADDVFQCPVCCEVLEEPRMLMCGHSFCRACLDRWLAQRAMCPLCNRAVDTLPVRNIALEHIIAQLRPNLARNAPSIKRKRRRRLDEVSLRSPALEVQLEVPQSEEEVEFCGLSSGSSHHHPATWAAVISDPGSTGPQSEDEASRSLAELPEALSDDLDVSLRPSAPSSAAAGVEYTLDLDMDEGLDQCSVVPSPGSLVDSRSGPALPSPISSGSEPPDVPGSGPPPLHLPESLSPSEPRSPSSAWRSPMRSPGQECLLSDASDGGHRAPSENSIAACASSPASPSAMEVYDSPHSKDVDGLRDDAGDSCDEAGSEDVEVASGSFDDSHGFLDNSSDEQLALSPVASG
mmetsp:Transcript_36700/g.80450  ORF Transcript_36700/g.80450 Transcript_36700/m.80450 type:complete len:370 (-) Transcript_36700:85-1194(-)